jgi:hypothetical protein
VSNLVEEEDPWVLLHEVQRGERYNAPRVRSYRGVDAIVREIEVGQVRRGPTRVQERIGQLIEQDRLTNLSRAQNDAGASIG